MAVTRYDVAIVGGGLAGCAAALFLRRRGARVVLLERRLCGSQASGVNYGGVRQQGRLKEELPISGRSRRLWSLLPELVGHDCEFSASGHLRLATSEQDLAGLEQWCAMAAEQGIASETLSRSMLAERFAFFGPGFVGGTLVPSDGQANPRLVAPAFARAARAEGADIREHCALAEVGHGSDGFHLLTGAGDEVASRYLVNVAGAWGHEIAARFGEPVPEDVEAPNMVVTEPVPYFLKPNLGIAGGNIYMRQIPRGNVIFGGGHGWADRDAVRARPMAEVTLGAIARAVTAVPLLANLQIIRTWTGIEGLMPDGQPVVGRSRTTTGLIHAFGFSGHGFQLGPGIGELIADLIVDGSVPEPLDMFDIGRFRT